MMLLKAESLTKSFGPLKVILKADLQINRGDSIGLVGVNGAGKSTFMRMLLGEMHPDTGEITRRTDRVGYLSQFPDSAPGLTVRDAMGRPYGRAEGIRLRMNELDRTMASGGDLDWNAVTEEYAALEAELGRMGLEDEEKLAEALEKVGLGRELLDREMETLSGGEKTKVMLARVLIQADGCELLFLDEPTSHLDVDTVEWLEDYLLDSHCSILVVSHDRYFLDKVSTRVAEISNGRTRDYKGNYSAFVMKKMLELDRQEKEFRRYSTQKKRLEEMAEEQHRNNWFSSIHKTTQKRIERLDEKVAPEERTEIKVRIQAASKSGKNVILGKGLSVDFGDRNIFSDVDVEVHKGDKLGIFGPNGEGKSTLIKALVGKIPCRGELWLAPGAKVGYYSQNHERLQLHLTAEEQILQAIGVDRKAEARGLLARMLLTGEAVERPMSTLSGGERARVALTLMLLEDTNLLVLDEPTNYLDIPVRHAVESALNDYDGTIIVVTHDRYLLDSVCNRVGELRDGRLRTYNGTYSEMKGRKNVMEIVEDADEYRALSSFTNWATGKKYGKGDRVLIAPSELKNFQWALDNDKLKKTGGRQRKKVAVEKEEEEEE